MNTVIKMPERGSGSTKKPARKKVAMNIDTDRLRQISDQLSELVEELDDIREDLNEMQENLEDVRDHSGPEKDYAVAHDTGVHDADTSGAKAAGTPLAKINNITAAVDSAYQELNEALDEMEDLL